jgi:hypothetical protein
VIIRVVELIDRSAGVPEKKQAGLSGFWSSTVLRYWGISVRIQKTGYLFYIISPIVLSGPR